MKLLEKISVIGARERSKHIPEDVISLNGHVDLATTGIVWTQKSGKRAVLGHCVAERTQKIEGVLVR